MHTRFSLTRPDTKYKMVNHKSRKATLQYATRMGFADYLRSLGDVPKAANARAAAMCDRVQDRSKARNGQQMERSLVQVFCSSATSVVFVF
jgi:hypothetical protein